MHLQYVKEIIRWIKASLNSLNQQKYQKRNIIILWKITDNTFKRTRTFGDYVESVNKLIFLSHL